MNRWLRNGISIGSGVAGGFGVLLLVIAMNRIDRTPKAPPAKKEIAFDVPEERKKPPTRKPRPKPPPKNKPKKPPPPTPQLAQAVGGVDVGLWAGSVIDLSEGTDSLLGDASNAVMTAETVDSLPEPTSQVAPPYPASARNKGITGFVRFSLDFDARGSLTNVSVTESQPPGIFEDAATRAIRQWRFRPATFQGKAVPVSGVEIKLQFDLER